MNAFFLGDTKAFGSIRTSFGVASIASNTLKFKVVGVIRASDTSKGKSGRPTKRRPTFDLRELKRVAALRKALLRKVSTTLTPTHPLPL